MNRDRDVGDERPAPVLAVDGLSKSFPGVRALHDVRFDVHAGEVHALLGENGAGKSTLIKIVSGVYRPDSGAIRVDGQEVRFAGPQEAQAAGIATVFQELLLFPDLTVAENIFLGHAPRSAWGGIDWTAMRARAAEILASLDIHELDVAAPVSTLSVANRQRVEIAKALSLERARADHGRADGGAARGRRAAAVRDRPQPARPRRRRRLHQPPHGGDLHAGRPGDRAARRRVRRDQAGGRHQRAGADHHDGRPRHRPSVPQARHRGRGHPCSRCRDLVSPPVVRGVSLTVRAGEIVGLAGLIGSGRSELAQTVFGISPATSGEILLDGEPVRIASAGQAKRHGHRLRARGPRHARA